MADQERRFKFTIKALDALQAPAKRLEYKDTLCPNLTVVVSPNGTKIFNRYGRVHNKPKRIRIGPYPDLTIEVARRACAKLNGEIAIGRDPQRERQLLRNGKKLGELWDHYHLNCSKGDDTKPNWKPPKRTWKRDESQWNRTLKDWEHRRINEIPRADIQARCQSLSDATGPGAGRKFVELLRSMYQEALRNRWCDEDPTQTVRFQIPHDRTRFVLPEEMPAFATAVAGLRDQRSKDLIWLCLFIGARRSNIAAMRWDELIWTPRQELWVIPAGKSKNKHAMYIALVPLAVDILLRRREDAGESPSPWVFPSTQNPSGHYLEPKTAFAKVLQKAKIDNLRLHDLRRTLGSWQAADNVSLEIIRQSLGQLTQRSTRIYAQLQLAPVRLAVDTATRAIKAAGEQEKT